MFVTYYVDEAVVLGDMIGTIHKICRYEERVCKSVTNPYSQFAAGLSTTTIQNLDLRGIAGGSQPGTYVVWVTFQSHQDPGKAPDQTDSCDDWTLYYTMVQSSGQWLIDSAKPPAGVSAYQSCG